MKNIRIGFSIFATIMCTLFLVIVNLITTQYIWFYYPVFVMLWWPLGVYLAKTKNIRVFSWLGAGLIMLNLVVSNYFSSPDYWWFIFALPAVIWWPIIMTAGKKRATFGFALFSFILLSCIYVLLNILYAPGHPWALYIIYALVWWPMATQRVIKERSLGISVMGTIVSIVFFSAVNYVTSPNYIWAIYPIFALLWWPLSVYYFNTKLRKEREKLL